MGYFSNDFINFFRELELNNNTEWFHQNKRTYEKAVKEPFVRFIDEMISRIRAHEPEISIKPADAIMRINNDIRFSKDKTPYKTHTGANISLFGKRDKGYPGFYMQLSHKSIDVYGGVYMIDNATLQNIRRYIVNNTEALRKAYGDQSFKNHFGVIRGEKNKRLPAEFQELMTREPLIANKQFYFAASLPSALLTSHTLADELMVYYHAGFSVNRFFKEAMK